MDTGIGFNAYSVIELKMIELILNDKTNEIYINEINTYSQENLIHEQSTDLFRAAP